MSAEDRTRWDAKYTGRCAPAPDTIGPAAVFARFVDAFPVAGHALDIACGQGAAAVWLARRGLQVAGCYISPVAVKMRGFRVYVEAFCHRENTKKTFRADRIVSIGRVEELECEL